MSNNNTEFDKEYLYNISDNELRRIIHSMVHDEPDLLDEIKDYHQNMMDYDYQEVGSDVESDLTLLDVHDLWETSGKTRYGYIEPGERAFEMMEEVLEPFQSDFQNKYNLGEIIVARQILKGVALGLYWYETRVEDEFKDWAVDCPYNLLLHILDDWNFDKEKILKKEWEELLALNWELGN